MRYAFVDTHSAVHLVTQITVKNVHLKEHLQTYLCHKLVPTREHGNEIKSQKKKKTQINANARK